MSSCAAFRLRPLNAFDRIIGHGVSLAEIFESRGERRETMADRAAAEPARCQLLAPGDDADAGHGAELVRLGNAGEAHKICDRLFIGASAARIADVGEQLDLGRHVGELVELDDGKQLVRRRVFRCYSTSAANRVSHGDILLKRHPLWTSATDRTREGRMISSPDGKPLTWGVGPWGFYGPCRSWLATQARWSVLIAMPRSWPQLMARWRGHHALPVWARQAPKRARPRE